MDVRNTFAQLAYAQARSAGAAVGLSAPAGPAGTTPEPAAQSLLSSFAETLRAGEKTATAAMIGNADPHALVQALAASELAVETAVTLRDKVVEAYQEILRMPV
jgi:flagellar hook-basal body complex protein FliE